MSNTTNQSTAIPDGYVVNARGKLVRESAMTEMDKLKNELAVERCVQAMLLRDKIAALRQEVVREAEALVDLAAAEHGITLGGDKGNLTIRSYSGQFKVEIVVQEFDTVADEEVLAAQVLIGEFFEEGLGNADKQVRIAVDRAFKRNQDGRLAIARLKELLTYEVIHPKWGRAMDIIRAALSVGGVRRYVRFFERVPGSFDKYQPIHLDIAKL